MTNLKTQKEQTKEHIRSTFPDHIEFRGQQFDFIDIESLDAGFRKRRLTKDFCGFAYACNQFWKTYFGGMCAAPNFGVTLIFCTEHEISLGFVLGRVEEAKLALRDGFERSTKNSSGHGYCTHGVIGELQ